jgi:hypothetical protein
VDPERERSCLGNRRTLDPGKGQEQHPPTPLTQYRPTHRALLASERVFVRWSGLAPGRDR